MLEMQEWLSVDIRVCPPTLLRDGRPALPCLSAVPLLSQLQAIAEVPMISLQDLLVSYFSSAQMDLSECLFLSMRYPEGSIINSLWVTHLTNVEEAWDHAACAESIAVHPCR